MAIEDRLLDGDPIMELGVDTGSGAVMRAHPVGPAAAPASTEYFDSGPLRSGLYTPRRQPLGRVDVSDVISSLRFRRVHQIMRVRRNASYRGPIEVVFETNVRAIIAEELGGLSSGPAPAQTTSRTQTTTAHAGGQIRGHNQSQSGSPRTVTRQTIPGTQMPFNKDAADLYGNWESAASQVGNSVDFENITDTMNGAETDSILETLGEIVRPRSWARHTVLQVQFRYPIMEPMLPATIWDADAIPFGDTLLEMEQNSALQNTVTEFTLMAGSSHKIVIPYPVGSSIPIHFDIVNHNPIYAANVNMSVTAYVTQE